MRRAILWLVLSAAALALMSPGTAQADPGGCVATAPAALPNGASNEMSCKWSVTGTTGTYLAGTANPWRITVARRVGTKWKTVQTIQGGGGDTTPPAGSMSVKKGDKVEVEIMSLCGPDAYYYSPPCAAAGFVAVMNA